MKNLITMQTPLNDENVHLNIMAVKIGDCLYASTNSVVNVEITQKHAREIFGELLDISAINTKRGLPGIPESFEIEIADGNTLYLDTILSLELVGTLSVFVVEQDLGNLLELFQPE